MNNSTTPTSASLLIDSLLPKQRAILYESLLNQKQALEYRLEKLAEIKGNTKYLRWYIKNLDETMKTLFAHCFPEDLKMNTKYFLQDLQKIESEKPANGHK